MRNFTSCTLDELIGSLQDARNTHGGDALVAFASDYGDHHHTQQVHELKGDVDEYSIKEFGYSTSGFALVDEDRVEPAEDAQSILIIS